MKCQSLFSVENKKNIISLPSAEFSQRSGKGLLTFDALKAQKRAS